MGNLSSAVDELLSADIAGMPVSAVMDDVVEIRRQINRLEAAYLDRLVVADRSGAAAGDHGSTQAWLRESCRLSPGRAHRDVHVSRDVADVLPMTRAAMADGIITVDHAQLIAGLRRSILPEALRNAEPHLVDFAEQASPQELRRVVTHVRHTYGPEKLRAAEREDYDARELHASTIMDGVGVGNWTLHPVGHETVMTALHAASRPSVGDGRSAAQRRADALVTIAEIALRSGELPVTGGVKPHVSVLVAWDTLSGQPGSPAADYGYGATSSSMWARRIACDAEISRIVTGPAGEILDAGRAVRTFSPAQRRAIVARDRHCVWPGCDTPAGWCDAHHRVHWAEGGPTSVENGVLLCGRHHDRVHVHGHAILTRTDGARTVDVRRGSAMDPPPRQRAGPIRQ